MSNVNLRQTRHSFTFDSISTPDGFEGDVFPEFTSLELDLSIDVLQSSAVAADGLMAGELSWTAFARSSDSQGGNPYNTTLSVQNMSLQPISLRSSGAI